MDKKKQDIYGTTPDHKFLMPGVALILLCICLIVPAFALSSDDTENVTANTTTLDTLSQAPFNPAFVSYVDGLHPVVKTLLRSSYAVTTTATTAPQHSLGLVPSPVWRPEISNIPMTGSGTETRLSSYSTGSGIPADAMNETKFDLRNYGKVSPVKNQGNFGACWAFASLASLESTLMPVTPTPDFSEKNLANLAGFDFAIPAGGGQVWMATAYLTRWNGPVDEATDPYPSVCWTSSRTYPPVKHVQDVVIFPIRTDRTDTENMKYALTTWGAAATGFFWDDSFYNDTYASYYEPATVSNPAQGGGHFVTIVGWDDTYAAGNFTDTPAGPGAWIVKNSWGTGWGDGGYFYVSYYDKYFASALDSRTESYYDSAVIFGEDTSDYNAIYSYDRLGEVTDYSYNTNKTGSFASVFTATTPGTVSAVGFYTADVNVPCTISVYKNPPSGPTGNTPVAEFDTTLPYMGYNTVDIPNGMRVPVTDGDRFSVVVTVTNPTYNYYIPAEINRANYTSGIVSSAGQSYVLGSSGWVDWKTVVTGWGVNNSNICLKAYTSATVTPTSDEDLVGGSGSSGVGGSTAATVSGIVAGQPATFSFNQNPGTTAPVALDTVQITFSQSPGTVDVTGLPVTDGGSPPGQTVVGYFRIEPVGVNQNAVSSGVITFSVSRQWLLDHDYDPANVVLMRNHDTQWTALPTTQSGLNGDTYSYQATTPGFSYFAVVVESPEPSATRTPEVTSSSASGTTPTFPIETTGSAALQETPAVRQGVTTAPVSAATTEIPSVPKAPAGISAWTIAGIVCIMLVIAGSAFILRRWWIRRQNPALFRKYD